MEEIWRDIKHYEGLYQVSDLGRVRSMDRVVNRKETRTQVAHTLFRRGEIMNLTMNKKGYNRVQFSKDGRVTSYLVHRLVLDAFVENKDNKPQVNHINCGKSDNLIANLEWCTNDENQAHAKSKGLKKGMKGSAHPKAKVTEMEVLDIVKLLNDGVKILDIMSMYGISRDVIGGIKYGRTWSHITGLEYINKKNSK